MTIEKELQTNSVNIDLNFTLSIRKIRDEGELKYQVMLKNNNNCNALPIRETSIPAKLKPKTKGIINTIISTTLKKAIESEQKRFERMLERFMRENWKSRTRQTKKSVHKLMNEQAQ